MKKVFKKAFIRIFHFFCLLFYPNNISRKILYYKNSLYTIWIGKHLGKKGNNVTIWSHVSFYGMPYVYIGDNSIIQDYVSIEAHYIYNGSNYIPLISIGKNCNIGQYSHITAIHKVIIGDGVLTGRRVTISDNNHGRFIMSDLKNPPAKRKLVCKGEVNIGNNVWIGENVCILSGTTIGEGSVIGANSVVTHDIAPYSMAVGAPARVIARLK